MSTAAHEILNNTMPAFARGIKYFAAEKAEFARHSQAAVISEGQNGITTVDDAAVYQTLLAADALRYLTLQVCSSKESGHPGGFASSADAYAALVMLGHTNIVTEVGHHAPGFLQCNDAGRLTAGNGYSYGRRHDGALPRASRPAWPPFRRHSRPVVTGRPAGPGTAFRHGRCLSASGQAVPVHPGRRRHGRTVYTVIDDALPYCISACDQLPAGTGVERLQPGASLHGFDQEQRGNDGLLEGAWL